ncbi:MAG TPA: methylenetetrahydrofolate reductase [NAD(P)H] [Candidatus Acidoferrales bacterium]|nr:methylenetetrahydrofolate reductase [NAD(P)H] [Candidatus Acidoferrales bacterium]
MELRQGHIRTFSFEFFPPKTLAGIDKLRNALAQLGSYGPKFFSCTYGAGGAARGRTLETVREIQSAGYAAAPHLTCVGSRPGQIEVLLDLYKREGIQHLVALRGDVPFAEQQPSEFRFASDLVAFIRRVTGTAFHLIVACYPEVHPQAPDARRDLEHFKVKVESGANAAITQYFYNPDAYFRFVEACEALHINIPIVPGIMPIGNFPQLVCFSNSCGAEIPRWLRLRMQAFGNDICSIRSYGLDVVTELCNRLLSGGAPGLHFYTMNDAELTSTIWQRLRF